MASKAVMSEVLFVGLVEAMHLLYTICPSAFTPIARKEETPTMEYAGATPTSETAFENTGEPSGEKEESPMMQAVAEQLEMIFLIAQMFDALVRTYPGLQAELGELLSRLWERIDGFSTRWFGVSVYAEAESEG